MAVRLGDAFCHELALDHLDTHPLQDATIGPTEVGWSRSGHRLDGASLVPVRQTLPEASSGDILIVDDKPANLAAVEAILCEFNCGVQRALSGAEALRELLDHDYSLILLDVQMPEMDGFETARLIRQRSRSRHTPIIFVTAFPHDSSDVLRAYELGAVDFLFKPISPEVLRAKVSVLLELQRRTLETARQAEQLREHERREHERELAEERRRWEAEALRRQVEEERRATVELAKRAAELTRMVLELERAERELTRMNEELAAVDRRKDEFLAILAHELRNPLAPVVTSIDILRMELASAEPGARAARTLEAMDRQIGHLTRLVDDLLDVSRINSGKIVLQKAPIDLSEVVEQAVLAARTAISERRHCVRVSTGDGPAMVVADAVRLGQVVANLVHNAARYTPPGGEIRVSVEQREDEVVVRVADNGQGISPDMLGSVFEMFVQESAGGGGLGVGLALVKRLVELHDGSVRVHSEGQGRGSEFEIRLPRGEVQAAERPTPPAARPALESLKILVVDDNPDICELVADLLGGLGHEVAQAATGAQALELLEGLQLDAAIVDLGLPDIDGWAVARTARQRWKERPLRLIAMSGYGSDADRERALDAGFDAHVVKPAKLDTILRALAGPVQASHP